MKCPQCSLDAEWHDDGNCPTYGQAAKYLFKTNDEPTDLRELVTDRKVYYDVKQVGRNWAIIQSYINDYGRRVNELCDVAAERSELEPLLNDYQKVGKVLFG